MRRNCLMMQQMGVSLGYCRSQRMTWRTYHSARTTISRPWIRMMIPTGAPQMTTLKRSSYTKKCTWRNQKRLRKPWDKLHVLKTISSKKWKYWWRRRISILTSTIEANMSRKTRKAQRNQMRASRRRAAPMSHTRSRRPQCWITPASTWQVCKSRIQTKSCTRRPKLPKTW